ncbi:MAG: hypothetical protein R3C24_02185 [Cyanobacteriota/Melainabacteria group bacterium]
MKLSGGARELGQEGLDGFREVKHVHWEFATSAKSYWFLRKERLKLRN